MYKINVNHSLEQVRNLLGSCAAADHLMPINQEPWTSLSMVPMKNFVENGWSPESMVEGFEKVLELCQSGKRIYHPLWTQALAQKDPTVRVRCLLHFPVERKSPFLLLACGGAYGCVASMIEGYHTCKEINDLGYHVFLLQYRTGSTAKAPNPVEDMSAAVRYILENAGELNVDSVNYAVGGFSAGGHLAASFGTERNGWKEYGLPAPVTEVLAYPVITMSSFTHEDSRRNFLQDQADDEKVRDCWSVEKQVTHGYPATYVWQCEKDKAVPIQNTQMLVEALKENGVSVEYETFDSECHGWGGARGTLAEGWPARAVAFWEKQMK